jgi:5,5'-dehydrodivanillate O-demethylase
VAGVVAAAAQHGWSRVATEERATLLDRWAAELDADRARFVDLLVREIGKPRRAAEEEVGRAAAHVRTAAELVRETRALSVAPGVSAVPRPVGVVGLVTPWNNPLAIPVGKIAPAIGFGNGVVLKPAPQGSLTAHALLETLERAAAPTGLVNAVFGAADAVRAVCRDPHVAAVSVTGSIATGRAVAAFAADAMKPLQAELGGNNAAVVLADADLERVVPDLVRAAFVFAGQRCTATVASWSSVPVASRFTALAIDAVRALVIGDPRRPATEVGPLVSVEHRARVTATLARARADGARLLVGGTVPRASRTAPGSRRRSWPTPRPRAPSCRRRRSVRSPSCRWRTTSSTRSRSRTTSAQGLLQSVHTRDAAARARALAAADVGMVQLAAGPLAVHPRAPFSAWKASGLGPPEHGVWDAWFYTRTQAIYGEDRRADARAAGRAHASRSGNPDGRGAPALLVPVTASSALAPGQAMPVRLLGEDFALFRTRDGVPGLVDARCPHRGASLAYGWVDESGLRCAYHGWCFDRDGACRDVPSLAGAGTDGSSVRDRVRVRAHRVEELGGLVFAYVGPEPAPLLPRYDLFVWRGVLRDVGRAILPCNWLQIMENSVDPGAPRMAPRPPSRRRARRRRRAGADPVPAPARGDRLRRLPVRHREAARARGRQSRGRRLARRAPARVPVHGRVGAQRQHRFQIRVPVDDTHTLHFWYSCYLPRPGAPEPVQQTIPLYDVPFRDEPASSFLDFVDGGDIMTWVTQGAIADRTRETLVDTDRGVALLRRVLFEQIERVRNGEDPLGVVRSPKENELIELPQESEKYGAGDAFLAESIAMSHVRYSPIRDEIAALLGLAPPG